MRHVLAMLLLALTSTCVMPPLAPAAAPPEYLEPDVAEWFATLRLPDSAFAACCGEGDAYYADEVAPCLSTDRVDCALVAIVTDTRPNEITVLMKNGVIKKVYRPPVAPGTRVAVPRVKLRKVPVPNPTEHTVIFLGVDELGAVSVVHCYEPLAGQ